MVGHQRDFVAVEHFVAVKASKFLDCHGACDVVAQNQVKLSLYELAGFDRIQSRVRGKYLLRHCHSHKIYNLLKESLIFALFVIPSAFLPLFFRLRLRLFGVFFRVFRFVGADRNPAFTAVRLFLRRLA